LKDRLKPATSPEAQITDFTLERWSASKEFKAAGRLVVCGAAGRNDELGVNFDMRSCV
jgi:hypothetical protein